MASFAIKIGTYAIGTQAAVNALRLATSRRLSEYPIIRSNVTVVPEGKMNSLKIDLSGTIVGSDYTSLRTALLELRGALESTTQNFYIDDERYARVVSKNFDYAFVKQDYCNYNISFVSGLPYFLAVNADSYVVSLSSGATFPVSNAGDVEVPLKFVFGNALDGTIADNIQFENKSLGTLFKYRGNLGVAGQITITNPDFEAWSAGTDADPDGWLSSGCIAVAEETIKKTGTYSCKVTANSAGDQLYQSYPDFASLQGKQICFSAWLQATEANQWYLSISDGVGGSTSPFHTGGGDWEYMTVSHLVSTSATLAWVQIYSGPGNPTADIYIDDTILIYGTSPIGDVLDIDAGFDNNNATQFVASVNGTNAMNNFEGDFISLKAGTNNLEYTGSVNGTLTLYWRKGYYS